MDEVEVWQAPFMVYPCARRNVVSIPEPEYVDGLSLIMHAESRSKRAQVSLHGADTDTEELSCFVMATSSDIRAQDFHLALRWR